MNETMAQIASRIAAEHGLTLADLRGPERSKRVALARHEAFAVIYDTGRYSTTQIGREFNRDHTTVVSGRAVHARRLLQPLAAGEVEPAAVEFWTKDRRADFLRRVEAGERDAVIGRALGVSPRVIQKRRLALQIKRKAEVYTLSPEQVESVAALRFSGLGEQGIAKAVGAPLSPVRRAIGLLRIDEPSRPRDDCKDQRFVAKLLALGGLPRAAVIEGRTVWLGPDNRPWRPRQAVEVAA